MRPGLAMVSAMVALALAGCSISMPIASLVSEPETTGSITPKAPSPLSSDLNAEDWRRARAALGVALDPQGSGTPVSWDNPESGFRGTFTPVGQPFVQSDEVCRAFLAQVTSPMRTSSLQGSACRPSGGEWAVKEARPFKGGVG